MRNKIKTPPIEKGGSKKKKILLWCAIIIVVFYAIIAIAPSEPQKKLTYTEEIAENWEVPKKEVKSIVSVAKELGIKKSKINIKSLSEDSCTIKYLDTNLTFKVKDNEVTSVKKDNTVLYENDSVVRMPKTIIVTQKEKEQLYDWTKIAVNLFMNLQESSDFDSIKSFEFAKGDNIYLIKGATSVDDKRVEFVASCEWTGNENDTPTWKDIQLFPVK